MNDNNSVPTITLHDPKPWYEVDPVVINAMELTGASYEELNAGVSLCVDVWDADSPNTFLINCRIKWVKYTYDLTGFAIARYFWTNPEKDTLLSEVVTTEYQRRRESLELEIKKEREKNAGYGKTNPKKDEIIEEFKLWKEKYPQGSCRQFHQQLTRQTKRGEKIPSVRSIQDWTKILRN